VTAVGPAEAARRVVRAVGVVLIVLGIVHLIATPHIPALLNGLRGTTAYHWALGPTLLNHVLVGVLLIPLGVSTWTAAAQGQAEAGWARRLLLVNAAAVLALPISIAALMRDAVYYTSPLFVIGVGLVGLIALLMAVAVVLVVVQGRSG